MKKVVFRASSTAPKVTWVSRVECSRPVQLVKAIKQHTECFCHYFDEDGNEIQYLDDALIALGVKPEDLRTFKMRHGFFVIDPPENPFKTGRFWKRLLFLILIIGIVLAAVFALRYFGLI